MTTERTRPARSEGQWALGETTPLNENEQIKLDDPALNVQQRILDVYSHQGFDAITLDDLRQRFRWMGLYTQRVQGYDGTYTGDDNIDLLEAPYFMMRVRTDGVALSARAVTILGEISRDYARGTVDISDRQNLQYHWIDVKDVPAIWEKLATVNLSTLEACGDCPRGMLGSPLAGESVDEVIDGSPALQQIVKDYIGNPEFANLPRKFKTAISGLQDVGHHINDVSFVGVVHPEHGPGFDLWVGGGLSTNPILAQRLGAWVPLDKVPEVWKAVVSLFRDYGYRRIRSKARLKFLVKDWGPAKFREVLETEYLHYRLADGPAPSGPDQLDHIGVHKLKNGHNAIGASPIVGRLNDQILLGLARLMEQVGSDRLRLSNRQKLILLDVPDEHLEKAITGLRELGLETYPSPWRRHILSCSGLEFCKLAFTETRTLAQTLVPELEKRMADINDQLDVPITIHLNGCPNSCARVQVADIGFKGQIITDENGNSIPGFQVHLGGQLGHQFGRKLRGHKIAASEVANYIERLVRHFLDHRDDHEPFAQWVLRADEELLQ